MSNNSVNSTSNIKKSIPITIFTGFLGSGKTTLVNNLVKENPELKIGIIVNEFGEVGIDNLLIESGKDEIVELSNGCMCCIVRTDLYTATEKLITENPDINYIVIEASGLAEPKPIADTYVMNTLDDKVKLDSICCLIDFVNYNFTSDQYKIAIEQVKYADFIVFNKLTSKISKNEVEALKTTIKKINQAAVFLENWEESPVNTRLLIDTGKWDEEKLLALEKEDAEKTDKEHSHDHHNHHNHEDHSHHEHNHSDHEHFDEVVYISDKNKFFDPAKLDNWLQFKFPEGCVRSKGLILLKVNEEKNGLYLFQMIGASKMLTEFITTKTDIDLTYTRLVFIGKNLDKSQLTSDLNNCLVD